MVRLSMTKDEIKHAPDYDADTWNDQTRTQHGEYYGPYSRDCTTAPPTHRRGATFGCPAVSLSGGPLYWTLMVLAVMLVASWGSGMVARVPANTMPMVLPLAAVTLPVRL